MTDPCVECDYVGENWICLKPNCATVACSRYVKSHMREDHAVKNPDHPIVFSFADFSFWCYECDTYIVHPLLTHQRFFYAQKFPQEVDMKQALAEMKEVKFDEPKPKLIDSEPKPKSEAPKEETKDELVDQMGKLEIDDDVWSYDKLVKGLRDGKFKKILVMTGAGISVSAGIPDFRSPGTGLYDNLNEYDLPFPEAIFTLDYFVEKPEPFYRFAEFFTLDKYEATPTHYFIKMLQDKKLLLKNMT